MNKYLPMLVLILLTSFIGQGMWVQNSYAQEEPDHEEHSDHGDEHQDATKISDESANKAGIIIEEVAPQKIHTSVVLSGTIILNQDKTYDLRARFPGLVRAVRVNLGDAVVKGQILAQVESNDSLKLYAIKAPDQGVVIKRSTNIGNVATDDVLLTIADLSTVWAEFHIFPRNADKVAKGQNISVNTLEGTASEAGEIMMVLPVADSKSQTIIAVASLPNPEAKWRPGMRVEGRVLTINKEVPLAVKQTALQNMEGKTVVFIKEGSGYISRHVKLGKGEGEYIEVLEGLSKGEQYVSNGSFIIKADILKSTASHSH